MMKELKIVSKKKCLVWWEHLRGAFCISLELGKWQGMDLLVRRGWQQVLSLWVSEFEGEGNKTRMSQHPRDLGVQNENGSGDLKIERDQLHYSGLGNTGLHPNSSSFSSRLPWHPPRR